MNYTKLPATNGCQGCVAERDKDLCPSLELCSPKYNGGVSVIFVESDKANETKPNR